MPFTPILASVNRLIRYHLGTVAKGSFIITLVKIPRMILMYIHSQLKGKVRKNLFWTLCGHIPDLSSARSKIPNDIKSKCECFLPCPCQVESNSVSLFPTLVLICSGKMYLITGFPKYPVLLFLCVNPHFPPWNPPSCP